MVSKILLLLFLFLNFSFASFELVRVGNIDKYYQSQISKEELKSIILNIEHTLESQLQMNVFDYSESGKPIDLVYVAPSTLEQKMNIKIDQLKSYQKKIQEMQEYFPKNQELINKYKENFEKSNMSLNERVKKFNDYVKEINKRKNIPKNELEKIKTEVNSRKKSLDSEISQMNKYRNDVRKKVDNFNNKVNSFNSLIADYKRLNKEIETMSRGFKKVKGMTFGVKEINTKTYFKDGVKVKEKREKNSMNKIEIYGFESINELKAILAHEISHLVGIPHIEDKYALMNPMIQKNQIENLKLTTPDIINFKKNF